MPVSRWPGQLRGGSWSSLEASSGVPGRASLASSIYCELFIVTGENWEKRKQVIAQATACLHVVFNVPWEAHTPVRALLMIMIGCRYDGNRSVDDVAATTRYSRNHTLSVANICLTCYQMTFQKR